MGKITKIIRDDLRGAKYDIKYYASEAKDMLISGGKQIGKGVAYGLVTPFDLKTGIEHFNDIAIEGEILDGLAQGYTSVGTTVAATALPPELRLAYFGTAAATNIGINVGKHLNSFLKRVKEK